MYWIYKSDRKNLSILHIQGCTKNICVKIYYIEEIKKFEIIPAFV